MGDVVNREMFSIGRCCQSGNVGNIPFMPSVVNNYDFYCYNIYYLLANFYLGIYFLIYVYN